MINVSRVLRSRHLRQTITVTRTTGQFGKGGWIADEPTTVTMSAVVYPTTSHEIQQVPEADRVQGMMTFLTLVPVYLSRKQTGLQGISDYATWNGEQYKIVNTLPYKDYGYYMSVGVRVKGA